ncbi:MAG: hypothetical protein J7551_07080 [Chloroflexi bacterium]|nr:hypothetical protein [Chloroflexota bacterium]
MIFPYHAERIGLPVLLLPLGVALLGVWLGGVLGVVFWGSGLGVWLWAALQGLRWGRGVRLYESYLLVQGSVTGRARRIPYAHVLGFAITPRGGLALLYIEPSAAPQQAQPTESLVNLPLEERPPRRSLILTARLAQPEALRKALAERLSNQLSVPESYVARLARRRRLRDALIVLLALLATPIYVLLLNRILSSLI